MSIFFCIFLRYGFFSELPDASVFLCQKKVRNLEKYILRHYFIIFKRGYQMESSNEDHIGKNPG